MSRTEKFLRFPGGKSKAVTLSYDDGVRADIHLTDLLRQANMKATFNINSGCFRSVDIPADDAKYHQRLTAEECVTIYDPNFFEVAVHGNNHYDLPSLDSAAMCCQVLDDRRSLESLFGRQIRGMAYPYGTFNDTVIQVLKLCGIRYSRTTVSTEKFTLPKTQDDWLRLPTTCKHTNPRLMELCDRFLSLTPKRAPQLFYLWGHSYEFGDDNNWHVIDQFINKMKGYDEIWYATNMEIYQAWEDFQRLETSADGSRIYNSCVRSVWFAAYNGEIYEVKPGETITL